MGRIRLHLRDPVTFFLLRHELPPSPGQMTNGAERWGCIDLCSYSKCASRTTALRRLPVVGHLFMLACGGASCRRKRLWTERGRTPARESRRAPRRESSFAKKYTTFAKANTARHLPSKRSQLVYRRHAVPV